MKLVTSESVSDGHPDKMADQIADAILDDIISKDLNARVACEVLLKNDSIFICGEITTKCSYDLEKIVKRTLSKIGDDSSLGFCIDSCNITTKITAQSEDIAKGVDREEICAGDQGIMFGYATDETEELMPVPILYAHKLMKRHSDLRKKGVIPWLLADAKTQVTFVYINGKPAYVDTIILSTQHIADVSLKEVRKEVISSIILEVIPEKFLTKDSRYIVNPAGEFIVGGIQADCGLTGRKLMVDTYGSACRHGGGGFSGKDPTKVDRSGAYMCRYIAKNLVANGIARKCEVQLSYCIGQPDPISVSVETFGTAELKDKEIGDMIKRDFDLRVGGIIRELSLLSPIYEKTAVYGHFGRNDPDFKWEVTLL